MIRNGEILRHSLELIIILVHAELLLWALCAITARERAGNFAELFFLTYRSDILSSYSPCYKQELIQCLRIEESRREAYAD